MLDVIDAKIYDTETATKLGSWSNKHSREDKEWIEETLYKTKKGNYFLHGMGGSLTPYGQTYGTETCRGCHIKPLTRSEAAKWAIKHDKNLYYREFPDEFEEA